MNDLYNERIMRNGREYRYDPDLDCYHRVEGDLSPFDRWAWIVVAGVLLALAVYLDYVG